MIKFDVALRGLCNGRLFFVNPIEGEEKGVFRVDCPVRERDGIRLFSPVVTNISNGEIRFRRAFASVILPPGPYECYAQYNRWGHENLGSWKALDGRGVFLTHVKGRTTEGNTPFIAFRENGCSHGVAMHLLPMGNWRIIAYPAICGNAEPQVVVDMGLSDECLDYPLQPGESWRLPEIIVQPFGDFKASTGGLHHFLMEEFPVSQRIPPVEYNTWIDRYDQLDVPHLREELAAAREVGCEAFVIDAGWYGADNLPWSQATGNWEESRKSAFYGKMAEFSDEVRAAGLQFGLWIEPERFNRDVPVLMEHPEWFAETGNGNFRVRLDIQEAWEYQKQTFLRLIDTYRLGYVKTDMNGWLGIDESNTEHNRYQTLFYRLIDEVHALRPDVFIECCASGAMRSDLEGLRHFDVMFPTDNAHPFEVNQVVAGFWRRMLPGRIMRWAVFRQDDGLVPFYEAWVHPVITPKGGTWDEFEGVDLESLLCANFTGGMLGFTGSMASLSEENRYIVAKAIRLFKEHRTLMLNAAGYCLAETSEWMALELAHGGNAVIMLQYLGSMQVGTKTVYPLELEAEALYQCPDGECRTGKAIMQNGLEIPLEKTGQLVGWRAKLVFLERKE